MVMPIWHHTSRLLFACRSPYAGHPVSETPFGAFLCEQLRARGWSQRHFAGLIDIDQAQLGRIVRGSRRPPLDQLGSWAEVLGIDAPAARELASLALIEHHATWIAAQLRQATPGRRAAEPAQRYDRVRKPAPP